MADKRLRLFFFGNCQVRVLYHALRSYSCIFDVYFVSEVQDTSAEDLPRILEYTELCDVLIYQAVNNSKFLISSNDILKHLRCDAMSVLIPSLYFDGYWPNLLDLFLGPYMPEIADGVLYHILLSKPNIEQNVAAATYFDTIGRLNTTAIQLHIYNALKSLKEREEVNGVDIQISDWINKHYKEGVLFYTCNHPKRRVFDYVTQCIVDLIQKQYSREIPVDALSKEYDMSSIDFLVYPPTGTVLTHIGYPSSNTTLHYCRYAKGRFVNEPHTFQSFQVEFDRYRAAISALPAEKRDANSRLLRDNKSLSSLLSLQSV